MALHGISGPSQDHDDYECRQHPFAAAACGDESGSAQRNAASGRRAALGGVHRQDPAARRTVRDLPVRCSRQSGARGAGAAEPAQQASARPASRHRRRHYAGGQLGTRHQGRALCASDRGQQRRRSGDDRSARVRAPHRRFGAGQACGHSRADGADEGGYRQRDGAAQGRGQRVAEPPSPADGQHPRIDHRRVDQQRAQQQQQDRLQRRGWQRHRHRGPGFGSDEGARGLSGRQRGHPRGAQRRHVQHRRGQLDDRGRQHGIVDARQLGAEHLRGADCRRQRCDAGPVRPWYARGRDRRRLRQVLCFQHAR